MNKTDLKKLSGRLLHIENNILYTDFFVLDLNKISYLKESPDKLKLIEYFKKNGTGIKDQQIDFLGNLLKNMPDQKSFEYGKRAFLKHGTLSPLEKNFYNFVNYNKDQFYNINKEIIDLIVDLFYYTDSPDVDLIMSESDKQLVYIYMNGKKIGITTIIKN